MLWIRVIALALSAAGARWDEQNPLTPEGQFREISPSRSIAYKLLHDGTVLSWNDTTKTVQVLENHSILIAGDVIENIFPANEDDINLLDRAIEVISMKGKIVSPGFIDSHIHLWLSAYKTVGVNTTLAEYAFRYGEFSAAQFIYEPDDVYFSQLKGIYEGINGGTTTFVDHASHTWSTEKSFAGFNASVESGARVHWCFAFHNVSTGYTREDQERDYQFLASMDRTKWNLASLGIAYDNSYAEDLATVRHVFELAEESNASVVTMHYIGGPWGLENSPTLLERLGLLNNSTPILFAHASFVNTEDAQNLRATNQHMVTTPESEMNFGQANPTSHLIQDQAALGSDGNPEYGGDMMSQGRIWLQLVRIRLFTALLDRWRVPRTNPMDANQAFLLATRNGGLALRRPDLGVLTAGAKADIVVFDPSSPAMLGYRDPVAAIMMFATPADVQHVLIGGEFRKRNHKLVVSRDVGQTWPEIERRFVQTAHSVQDKILAVPAPSLDGEWAPGVLYGDPDEIDVVRGQGTGY